MTLLYVLIGLVVCAVIVGLIVDHSPEGWEDEHGFHYGRQP